jgi:hypothetical protein
VLGHLLNHTHDIWTESTALDGPLTNTLDLTLDEVKDTKQLCIWCHPMEKVPGVICNSTLVTTLAVNGLLEHPIYVLVGGMKAIDLPN